jgi:hypothetical protein
MLANNGVNPYTGRKFSKSFTRKFNKIYSDTLHAKGINQPEFRELYDEDIFKDVPLEDEKKEDTVPVQKLVIPDLWDMLSSSVGEKRSVADEERREEHLQVLKLDSDATDDDIKEAFAKLTQKYAKKPEKKKAVEHAYAALINEDEETTTDSESDEETTTDSESDEESDTDEKTSSEEISPKKQSKKSEEKKGDVESEKKSNKIKAGMGMNPKDDKSTDVCCYCKGKIGDQQIRSVVMKSGNPEVCNFCCLDCMEKYNFGRYRK